MTRTLRAAACLAALGAALSVPVFAARPRVYALVGGTVIPSPGRKIEGGVVVLRDGLIEAVGAGVAVPGDAEVIDARGLFVYPAFLDASGRIPGAPEAPERPARQGPSVDEAEEEFRAGTPPAPPSAPGSVHPVSRIRPEREAEELLTPYAGDRRRDLEALRALGFAAAYVAPPQGIFRGRGAVILLQDDAPVSALLLKRDVAQQVAFEYGSFGEGYPSSLMGAVAAIRQTLLDARRYAQWERRWEGAPAGMARPERLAAYETLLPVLDRKIPAIFQLDDPADLRLVRRVASEFGLEAVVAASGFEADAVSAAAEAKIPLLFPARFPDRPRAADADDAWDLTTRELRRYAEAPSAPGRLHGAGVPLALTLRGLKNTADFPGNLRAMIEAGLPEDAALRALTVEPARLLRVDAVLGTLDPGKIANVIVADAPIFSKDARVRRVYVDGREYVLEEKAKPKGDPGAVIDPRGTWSVVLEMGNQTLQRTWTIAGAKGAWTGTAETRSGTVGFDRVAVEGNVLTVVFPASEGRGATEVSVIVSGDVFEGTAEFGPRSVPVRGTRTRGPEGGRR